MRKYLFLICLIFASQLYAQPKIYVRSYTYHASDLDSKVSARAAALGQVRHMLLSELGTYVDSKISIKKSSDGSTVSKHEITAIAAGIVQTEILKEIWNGELYFTQVKLIADPDEIIKKLKEKYKTHSYVSDTKAHAQPGKTEHSSSFLASGNKITLLVRHNVSARSIEDRDELTALLLKTIQSEMGKVLPKKVAITTVSDFDITDKLLRETEDGEQSKYMCFLYDANYVVATILEDWDQDLHSSGTNHLRELSFIIYECKTEMLERYVFRPEYIYGGVYEREKSVEKEFRRFLKNYIRGEG